MKVSKEEIERRMNRFENVCRESGAKLTHQRTEIFREVAQSADHPDAEEVYLAVRRRLPTVSLDTVYRTLWWLKDLGLITVLGPSRERARFDANLSRHHHFVCTMCGLTQDFTSDELDGLDLPDSIRSIGQMDRIQVEAIGLCMNCTSKEASSKKKRQRR
jgi:Fur family peroxide stress response transcriptional regulator